VQESTILETEPLAFETEVKPAPDMELDQQEVIQNGVYGLKAKRIRIRLEDGQEVSRHIEEEYIAIEPQPKIVGFGTKIVPHTLETPGENITYWRALNMYAVSYNPTSAGDSTTATGATLQKGIAAIDPTIIPYGTQMYIPGYGVAVAADTGGGVKGRLIDLGYSDHDYVSWHQWVTVYFLWPPPSNVVWVIP
jgi:3D (Asp-Asp-Asp) domain-containing protein